MVRQEHFDGLSGRQKQPVKFFDGSVKIAISTKHFLTDLLSVKISVKKPTFRQKINLFPSKIPSEKGPLTCSFLSWTSSLAMAYE